MATVPVVKSTNTIESVEVENRDEYPATSRYKNARYYNRSIPDIGKFIEPETWVPPTIPRTDNDLYTDVRAGEGGRLDLVASRVYRLEGLWWVIALHNDIIDPFEDAPVGRTLRYPPFDTVAATVLA